MFAIPRTVKYSALVLLLSTTAFIAPAYAVGATATPHYRAHHEWNMKERVEDRIKTLHDTLNITQEQESDWSDVADAMRDSQEKVGDLIKARRDNRENSTAIDDIKSYQEISLAHSNGMAKFLDVFEPFYDDLTSEQKLKADAFFKHYQRHSFPHPNHKKKAAKPAPAVKAK